MPSSPATLPRGRHGLSREEVQASQRRRLLEAMIEATCECGYAAVTISDIVGRARVARRTFYEHFAGKEACLLAAYDHTAGEVIVPLLGAFDPVDDVGVRARSYVRAALEALATRPALAQMLIVEVAAGGPAAVAHRLAMHRRIAGAIVELNRLTRARGIDVPEVSPTRALAIVGALIEPMHAALQDGGAAALRHLCDELTAVVTQLLGAPTV